MKRKYNQISHPYPLRSAAEERPLTGISLTDNRHASNATIQRAIIRTSKGTIIKSKLINANGSPAKDGKTRRGQIAGGIEHDDGTPGTNYAKNVKEVSKTDLGWTGGHVYKHQWGGGRTAGNLVVWPAAAESAWDHGFERRVQAFIDRGEETAIGVSWSRDDELIKKAPVMQNAKAKTMGLDGTKALFVQQSAELDRRRANSALAYIPISIAGTSNAGGLSMGDSNTKASYAAIHAEGQIDAKIAVSADRYEKAIGKGHYGRLVGDTNKAFNKSEKMQRLGKLTELEMYKQDEEGHKGSFGNIKLGYV